MGELLDEAAELASAGVKELLVIAQDITRYGTDFNGEHQLAKLLDGMICHVNLIPVNPVKERGYDRTAQQDIRRFVDTLGRLGVNATVRRELGSDINAACGQLRRQYEQGEEAKA